MFRLFKVWAQRICRGRPGVVGVQALAEDEEDGVVGVADCCFICFTGGVDGTRKAGALRFFATEGGFAWLKMVGTAS